MTSDLNLGTLRGTVDMQAPAFKLDLLTEKAAAARDTEDASASFLRGAQELDAAAMALQPAYRMEQLRDATTDASNAEAKTREAVDHAQTQDLSLSDQVLDKLDTFAAGRGVAKRVFPKMTKGAGPLTSMLGALAVLLAGDGFQFLLRTFGDFAQLFSEFLFVSLLPIVKRAAPVMQHLLDTIRDIMGGPGLQDASPEKLTELGSVLVAGFLKLSTGFVEIGTRIVDQLTAQIQNGLEGMREDLETLERPFQYLRESANAFLSASYDLADVFMQAMIELEDAWNHIGEYVRWHVTPDLVPGNAAAPKNEEQTVGGYSGQQSEDIING
jgi:hypothetical protein